MHHGDIVNMIDTTNNNFTNHTTEFIKNQQVDFIYEAAKQEMKIRSNYGQFLAQNQLVLEALRLNRCLTGILIRKDLMWHLLLYQERFLCMKVV
jgi:hypothetical protein